MNNDTTIGQNVFRLRRAANITQKELAAHLGLTHQQITKYENGQNRIAAGRVPHIAALFGCEIVDLFEGTES